MTKTTEITNPYSGNAPATQETGSVAIEQQRAIAQVRTAIMNAKEYPRDKKRAVDNILADCSRLSLAELAIYSYPRGKETVSGPTIRLVESIAREWGNIHFGINEISRSKGDSGNPGASVMEAWAWDLESNTRSNSIFVVNYIRNTKYGDKILTDERDIYEMNANMAARRLRGCILKLIPGDIVELAERQCNTTLQQNYEVTPENIKKLVETFKMFNVTKEQLENRMGGRRIDSITSQQIVALKKVYVSLRDRMSVAADWFDMPKNDQPAMSSAEQLTANRVPIVKREAKPTETPACDPSTGEVAPTDVTPPKIDDIIIVLPPGSTPPRVACNSVKEVAEEMVQAIGARYQKGNQEEIDWIMKNNAELLVRIQHEEPEKHKAICDLREVPTDTPNDGGLL